MAARKLTVEICNGRNLMAKDGRGSVNAYVTVDFDGQRRRTKTKPGDLNPQWDETLEFLVNDPAELAALTLEVNVYHDGKSKFQPRGSFLGRVKISGAAIPKLGDQSLVYYPLEKRSVFSQIRGEISLKLSYEDDPEVKREKEVTEEKREKVAEEKKEEIKEEKKDEAKEEKKEKEKEEEEKKEKEAEEKKEKEVEEKKEKEVEEKKEKEVEEKREKEDDVSLPVSSPSKMRPVSCSEGSIIRSTGGSFDLVDLVPYLFIRVVKVNAPSGQRVYAKVNVGTLTSRTRVAENGIFDQVFAFLKSGLNSTTVDFSVWAEKDEKEKDGADNCLGSLSFDLHGIPQRAPRDSPLAPQWHELTENGGAARSDVMLATWIGTQADESFSDAWHSDSTTPAMAYLSPKLWYLRLTVIQAQDLKSKSTDVFVKGQLGQQIFRTAKMAAPQNPTWHEDLVFVAAEPFDQHLLVSVEGQGKSTLGQAKIPLSHVRRQTVDFSDPPSEWVNLDSSGEPAGKLHVRVSLEGGYQVLDEPADVSRPLGKLEVGVRGVSVLGGGGGSAYVALRYGRKWIRTRTIDEKVNARWNEQYTWEVVDPCTVLTAAVFQNDGVAKDSFMGKIRIRLSSLDTNRIHVASFPLFHVTPGGSKKTGDLELAVRFTCFSQVGLIQSCTAPLLPRVHYQRPLAAAQQELLRGAAVRLAAQRLARSEPPLAAEAVHHVLDSDSSTWSLRRSKANWVRLARCLKWAVAAARWADSVKAWSNPTKTVFVHVLIIAALLFPELIFPVLFTVVFLCVVRGYVARPHWLLAVDPRLSCLDTVGNDELEEELDPLPTCQPEEKVKARYDRLRLLAGRAQGLVGDVAALGERIEALLTWRDQRATGVFAVACLFAAVVFYLVPFRVVALAAACYYLRHPRFRDELPAAPVNFFRRLPSRVDQII